MQVPPTFSEPQSSFPPPRRVRLAAIGEAWRWYMADVANWILATLLVGIIGAVPYFLIGLVVRLSLVGNLSSLNPSRITSNNIILILAVAPIGVLIQLLIVGLQHRAVLQVRGVKTEITEMFNLGGMGLQVLLYNIVFFLALLPLQIASALSQNPADPTAIFQSGHAIVYFGSLFVMFLIQILFSMTPLLIVDQKLNFGAAIVKNLRTFGPQFLPLAGVILCTMLFSFVGMVACCVGVLFTLPVLNVTYGVIYNDFFRATTTNDTPIEGDFGAYPRPQL
jgi:hypothetical protein